MKVMNFWILALSLVFAGSVYAGAYSDSGKTGAYIGAGAGASSVDISDDGISLDDDDTGWKIFGGYKFNQYYSAEAAWVDLGNFSDNVFIPFPFGVVGPVELEIEGFALSGLGTYPVNDSVTIFGRLGIWSWDSDASVLGTSSGDSGTDIMFGAGGSYTFTDAFAVRAEWERYQAGGDDADLIGISGVFSF